MPGHSREPSEGCVDATPLCPTQPTTADSGTLRAHRSANVKPALAPTGLSESELLAVLDQLPSGVAVVDARGRPTYLNPAAQGYLGSALERVHTLTQAAVLAGLRSSPSGRLISD